MRPFRLFNDDLLSALPDLDEGSVDAVVTDPPYGLEFMGKEWDSFSPGGKKPRLNPGTYRKMSKHGRPSGWTASGNPTCRNCGGDKYRNGSRKCVCDSPDFPNHAAFHNAAFQAWCLSWAESVLRVLKPGGYMLSFGGTRTYHRLACAVEDAGFEVRDCLMWIYGSGFPKGDGNLKPAYEPILLCRRPASRVLPLNVDECRVPTTDSLGGGHCTNGQQMSGGWRRPWMDNPEAVAANAARSREAVAKAEELGRYPANVTHDGSDEVAELLGEEARFFYCAKASKSDRGEGNTHPTVKPQALMEWLVKLVTTEGQTVLDPFMGSGSTGVACGTLNRKFLGVEKDTKNGYFATAKRRINQSYERALRRPQPLI